MVFLAEMAVTPVNLTTIVGAVLGSAGIGGSTIWYMKYQLKANKEKIAEVGGELKNHIDGHKQKDIDAAVNVEKLDNLTDMVKSMSSDVKTLMKGK